MNSTLGEVLEAARALPRAERAEIAHELIASLETANEYDEVRYAELKAAVQLGVDQIERGESIRIPAGELREFLHGLSSEATERIARKSA
jgi:hypothetical protein